jgi:hypothetical protein
MSFRLCSKPGADTGSEKDLLAFRIAGFGDCTFSIPIRLAERLVEEAETRERNKSRFADRGKIKTLFSDS